MLYVPPTHNLHPSPTPPTYLSPPLPPSLLSVGRRVSSRSIQAMDIEGDRHVGLRDLAMFLSCRTSRKREEYQMGLVMTILEDDRLSHHDRFNCKRKEEDVDEIGRRRNRRRSIIRGRGDGIEGKNKERNIIFLKERERERERVFLLSIALPLSLSSFLLLFFFFCFCFFFFFLSLFSLSSLSLSLSLSLSSLFSAR